MRKEERNLFKMLCGFKEDTFDEGLLAYATPAVLGHLFFNRMQGVAYYTLKRHGALGEVNREFRNSLRTAYEANAAKNRSFYTCIQMLERALEKADCPYAMLKGAYLCALYPEGCRTSNDIDLLVLPEDVTKISHALLAAGFLQGNVKNDAFIPASRQEIISSRMLRGELVPFIKEVDLPGMKFLEIDVNFSLDYKNSPKDALADMLSHTESKKVDEVAVRTLSAADFFIHLCSHLYKEATTLPWVKMHRDMTLYKYADIYALLDGMDEDAVEKVFLRARALGLDKECAFAVLETAALFDVKSGYAVMIAEDVLRDAPDFLHTVVSPAEGKRFVFWEKDILRRFFSDDRAELLREVTEDV